MAAKVGQEVILKIGSKLFAGITSHDFQTSIDMLETTDMHTPGKQRTFRSGRGNTTISIEALHDPTAQSGTYENFFTMHAAALAGTEASLYWGSTVALESYFTATGLISSISNKSQDNAVANWSCSFQITGAITAAIVST